MLRQLPTLPRRLQRSTLGLWTLNYCVRNGNRWNRPGIITALLTCPRAKPAGRMRLGNKPYGKVSQESSPKDADDWLTLTALNESCSLKTSQKKRQQIVRQYLLRIAVNVIQSHVAFARVLGTFSHTTCFPFSFILRIRFSDRSVSQALDRLVLVSCTHCCASTPSLSTLSSSRGLTSF